MASACSPDLHFADTGTGGHVVGSSSSTGVGGQWTTGLGSTSTGSTGSGGGSCVPETCIGLGLQCGAHPDGCGKMLDCGACPAGKVCGVKTDNQCGDPPCMPKTCAQLGATCGMISDGCTTMLNCGACTAPASCGGGGTANKCGCTPTTCSAKGAACGNISDGCFGTLSCGTCSGTLGCGAGGTANVCGQAAVLACNTCPAGFNFIQAIYNDLCNTGAACGAVQQIVCAAPAATVSVTMGSICSPGYHLGTTTPNCMVGTNALICVMD